MGEILLFPFTLFQGFLHPKKVVYERQVVIAFIARFMIWHRVLVKLSENDLCVYLTNMPIIATISARRAAPQSTAPSASYFIAGINRGARSGRDKEMNTQVRRWYTSLVCLVSTGGLISSPRGVYLGWRPLLPAPSKPRGTTRRPPDFRTLFSARGALLAVNSPPQATVSLKMADLQLTRCSITYVSPRGTCFFPLGCWAPTRGTSPPFLSAGTQKISPIHVGGKAALRDFWWRSRILLLYLHLIVLYVENNHFPDPSITPCARPASTAAVYSASVGVWGSGIGLSEYH